MKAAITGQTTSEARLLSSDCISRRVRIRNREIQRVRQIVRASRRQNPSRFRAGANQPAECSNPLYGWSNPRPE